MRVSSKPILAALVASALLALAVSGASARNFSVNERNFELIWNEALGAPKTKWSLTVPPFGVIECRLTLLGRYSASTIAKRTEVNAGTINHGEVESCVNATATIKTETMPWNVRYRGFTGTLPIIRSIIFGIRGFTWRIREGAFECTSASEANHPLVFILGNSSEALETDLERSGEAENATFEQGNTIPLGGEGFLCSFAGVESRFGGIGLVRNLPRTAKIRVTLI